jgi:hypothetical protein
VGGASDPTTASATDVQLEVVLSVAWAAHHTLIVNFDCC